MKKLCLTLLVGLGMLTGPAMAAVTQPANTAAEPPPMMPADTHCSISTSNSNVDYGAQSRWQLQDSQGNGQSVTPGKRQLQITVVCPFTQTIRLAIRGENATSGGFRYGDAGHMNVTLIGAQLDGQDTQVALTSQSGGLLSAPGSTLTLLPGAMFSPVTGNTLAQGKVFNARLEIEPVLTDSDARVTRSQSNEANLSFELME